MALLCVPIDWCSQKVERVDKVDCVRMANCICGIVKTVPALQISLQYSVLEQKIICEQFVDAWMSLFTKLHLKDDLKFTIFSLSIYKRIHGVEYQKETLVVEKGYHDEQ